MTNQMRREILHVLGELSHCCPEGAIRAIDG